MSPHQDRVKEGKEEEGCSRRQELRVDDKRANETLGLPDSRHA